MNEYIYSFHAPHNFTKIADIGVYGQTACCHGTDRQLKAEEAMAFLHFAVSYLLSSVVGSMVPNFPSSLIFADSFTFHI